MFVCLTLIYGIHVDIMIIHPEVSRVRKVFLTFSQCFKRIAAGEGAWDLVKKKNTSNTESDTRTTTWKSLSLLST